MKQALLLYQFTYQSAQVKHHTLKTLHTTLTY